jgi:hypothetical protein
LGHAIKSIAGFSYFLTVCMPLSSTLYGMQSGGIQLGT